ncbi:ABC transporter substrate-binding protein [Diplocloster agilis]|uniref:ABC transporter substrate-binding protein n=1 Tax=Diplocloster agilis TaxID=2850323 RepID=A0A949NH70_9FIRM|nr:MULTISPECIES: ABC transporter substrate-binding protein [Lachnospiraceae]MBU9735735.1 ABC transporter substrate-binding protein [Diplocloster agilis]MCU6732473.1 ABC transporter substrate-binding protein [Suonthocola fibrivorans]SCI48160.1 Maltose-binding periplasmic proteins/domains [uncultured Clostridium sp.]
MKKVVSIIVTLTMILSLAACSGKTQSTETGVGSSAAAGADTAEVKAEDGKKEMGKLVFSGFTGEPTSFQQYAIDKFKEAYPDVEVEYIVTDTGTREQVMKTAISAGDPPAIGAYWGTRINSFYDNGMCLDLKDLIDPEILGKVNSSLMEPCMGENGEVYAIPTDTTYHTVFYNKDMMDQYGFQVPETWDDMTAIFERLKQDDIFGFATNSASMQDCMYGMTYAELEAKVGKGTAWGVANGDVSVAPGSEAGEVIRTCIEQVKKWYEAGYWYPGDGGINCTADDANAAFAQGRCMFIFNYSGALGIHAESCDFEIGAFMKPVSEKGMTSYENVEPNVYFVPSNCTEAQINSAVAFLEIALSEEAQQAVIDGNNIPSVLSYTYQNIPPLLQDIMANLETGNLIAGVNPTRTSSEMQTFVKQQIFAAPCGGTMTIDETLNEMERIRLAAKQ